VDTAKEDIGEPTITIADEAPQDAPTAYSRLGGLLLLALLAYLVWRIVAPLWQPLVWAALLGSLLAPFNARLTLRLGARPRLASGITTLLAVLLFLLPVAIVAGAVATQAAQLLGRLNAQAPQMDAASLDLARIPRLARPLEWIGSHTTVTVEQLQGWLVEAAKRVLQSLASSGGNLVLGALGTVVSFALMLFVLFFVLRDGPALAQKVLRMLPIEERRRLRLWRHLVDVIHAVFMGIGLTALVQGVLLGVGFWIAGLPSPLVFGVLGYLFKKLRYPLTPLVLALVLGDKAEDSFRQSMLVSQGEMSIMFSNKLVGGITALALIMLFWPLISRLLALLRPPKPDEFAAERPVD